MRLRSSRHVRVLFPVKLSLETVRWDFARSQAQLATTLW